MIGKLITGPRWPFLNSDKPFVEVVGVYQELTRSLGAWAVDASGLVGGSGKPFASAVVDTDSAVLDCLFRPFSGDDDTKVALQLLCTTFDTFMQRAWAPYLEGGELAAVDEATTANLRKTNVHYRSSSPRLPKATSTPTAGSAPGANSALTIKYQDTEQSKSRGQTTKNLRS